MKNYYVESARKDLEVLRTLHNTQLEAIKKCLPCKSIEYPTWSGVFQAHTIMLCNHVESLERRIAKLESELREAVESPEYREPYITDLPDKEYLRDLGIEEAKARK